MKKNKERKKDAGHLDREREKERESVSVHRCEVSSILVVVYKECGPPREKGGTVKR